MNFLKLIRKLLSEDKPISPSTCSIKTAKNLIATLGQTFPLRRVPSKNLKRFNHYNELSNPKVISSFVFGDFAKYPCISFVRYSHNLNLPKNYLIPSQDESVYLFITLDSNQYDKNRFKKHKPAILEESKGKTLLRFDKKPIEKTNIKEQIKIIVEERT
jgi:hypothetical protein